MNKSKRRACRNAKNSTLFHWKPTFIREVFDNTLRMRGEGAHYFSNVRVWREAWRDRYYNARVGKY